MVLSRAAWHHPLKMGGPMGIDNIEQTYPLSPMQSGMLYHSIYTPKSAAYLLQIAGVAREPLNLPVFKRAWQRLADRHAVLRTSFCWTTTAEPIQQVHQDVTVPIEVFDWQRKSEEQCQDQLGKYLQTDRTRGLKLTEAPMMRVAVFVCRDGTFRFVWTFHHAILDGRSFPILLNELFAFYESFTQDRDLSLPPALQFRDYVDWSNGQDRTRSQHFWRDHLAGFDQATALVGMRSNVASSQDREDFASRKILLTPQTTGALHRIAETHDLAINTFVQAAWALLLIRYSGKTDVVFGAVRACRRWAEDGDSMVGLFVNTLPVRVSVSPESLLIPWLKQLRAQWVTMREHEGTPLIAVQGCSDMPQQQALFDSVVVFDHCDLNTLMRRLEGKWSNRYFEYHGQTHYPLTARAYLQPDLFFSIQYDRHRFDDAFIGRMLGHVESMLTGMAADPHACVANLPILTASETEQALGPPLIGKQEHPKRHCLHELFETWAGRNPDDVAAVCDDAQLTYGQLNDRANQLAHHLRKGGVAPEMRVGICMEPSLQLVVAMLGILKAGGAYVPLDPSYPKQRLDYMVDDADLSVMVIDPHQASRFAEAFKNPRMNVVKLDATWTTINQEGTTNPDTPIDPDNLAYVLYTSGTTGTPNGALVSHHNVIRLFGTTRQYFGFDEHDVWTMFHSFAFDFSVWEIWGALLHGGRIVIVPYRISRSPISFLDLLHRERVTVLNQTPSAFAQFMGVEETDSRTETTLRWVIFGGEALDLHSLKPWFDRHGDQKPCLVNMYGITETTVHVTCRPLSASDATEAPGSVIGRAIPDLQVYLLDRDRRLVPDGVPGEIYVGGAGVCRGYLNRPDLTAQRFINNPFSDDPHARLYKSGDLARRLDNGDIEYLGRTDQQVKIRGFRVEPAEIEAALQRYQGVRQTVVMARRDDGDDDYIAAYIVAGDGNTPTSTELRSHLRQTLPDYMIPSVFVVLDCLPLTLNGKIDRDALPRPQPQRPRLAQHYVAPRSTLERRLVEIWQNVLGVEPVGVHDNFFDLGGHSLKAITLLARIRDAFHIELPLRAIFDAPSVAELGPAVSNKMVAGASDQQLDELLSRIERTDETDDW